MQQILLRALFAILRIPFLRRLALHIYISASNRGSSIDSTHPSIALIYEPRFRFIKAALESRGINVIVVGRGLFDHRFRRRLALYLEKHQSFGEYALDNYVRYVEERRRYLDDCVYLAKLLKGYLPASVIVLPKYNDDFTIEVVQGFHDAGWTTVVYDREGTVTTKRLSHVPPIVAQQAPTCDYVATYNDTHRRFFDRVFELAGIAAPTIVIMGNPASDEWFQASLRSHKRDASASDRRILFFAFGEFSYVYDTDYLRGKSEVWRDLLSDIHQAFDAHLASHPLHELVYKRGPKGNRDYWPGSETLLGRPNATLVPSSANSNRLIMECDVVVAFQTTAIIDAMHTDRVILYCAWGSRYAELRHELIPFEDYAREGALVHVRSAAELRRYLDMDPGEISVNLEARKRIREQYTTNPDGQLAGRFAGWIIDTVIPRRAQEHVQQ